MQHIIQTNYTLEALRESRHLRREVENMFFDMDYGKKKKNTQCINRRVYDELPDENGEIRSRYYTVQASVTTRQAALFIY